MDLDSDSPMAASIALGPFVLERPIGSGGMADVWLATHRAQRHRVAVKVLTGERARDDKFIRALRNEIHSMARLNHPGIVLVFDTGEVDDDAERTSQGRLVRRAPWFAMELASRGAMSAKRLPLPWRTARHLLLSLLDALAHAHARGVIHRDLKPGNILLSGPDNPRPGIKITDFGIAQPAGDAIDGDAEKGQLSGTPRYMAPEQFEARWRDFGPWTDLYALGCIACQLATGAPPFSGDAARLAMAHCRDAPQVSAPHFPDYPEGFSAWVLRLLEKDPQRRFVCAADAAWALLTMENPGADSEKLLASGWEQVLGITDPLAGVAEGDATLATSLLAFGSIDEVNETVDDTDDGEVVDDAGHRAKAPQQEGPSSEITHLATMPARPSVSQAMVEADLRTDKTEPKHDRPSHTHAAARVAPRLVPRMASGFSEDIAAGRSDVMPDHNASSVPGGVSHDDVVRGALGGDDSVDDLVEGLHAREEAVTLSARTTHPPGQGRPPEDESKLAVRCPPPFPSTWRRLGTHPAVRHLLGAGLGLYGLRQVPLVARELERDHLWATLRDVHEGRGARIVVIRGPAGIGKTRLAEWFVERSVEVGAAVGLRAAHGPGGGPLDGLPGIVALHARTLGLRSQKLKRRLLDVVRRQGVSDLDEPLALADLLEPAAEQTTLRLPVEHRAVADADARDVARVRLGSAEERHALVLRYIARVAKDRPAVVWCDDVQWGLDVIAFAQYLLNDSVGRTTPVVMILSASDQALGERPVEAAALDVLLDHPHVVELRLSHLSDTDHRALVGELLGLEHGLAAQVATRTAGNPMFAVQLVGDFVGRGVLQLGPTGFALRSGEKAVLPDSLHEIWSARLTRVLSRAPPGSQTALELGSVLGTSGSDGEWRALCDEASVPLSPALIDELLVTRLIVPDEGGLHFAHAMLRESVLRAAAEGGRIEGHHRVAARMLEKRYGDRRGVAERIGRHLAAAGDAELALSPLLRAAHEAARTHGPHRAHAILADRDVLIDRLGLPEDHPCRVAGWGLKAELLLEEGKIDDASAWSSLVLRQREDARSARSRAQALRVAALVAHQRARWDEGNRWLYEARRIAEQCGDDELVMMCLSSLADGAYARGRLDDSAALYAQALHACEARGDEAGMAAALWNLAYVSLWRGDVTAAREQLARQQKLARRLGHRAIIANGKNALGDLERFCGNYDAAEARYDDALRMFEAIGFGKRYTVKVNLAMNALGRGLMQTALETACTVLPEVTQTDPALKALCHGVIAVVKAHASQWRAFDTHFHVLAQSHAEKDLIDADGAWLFEMIGDHARAHGEDERAARAYENAVDLWRILGRQDRVDGALRALGALKTVPRRRG